MTRAMKARREAESKGRKMEGIDVHDSVTGDSRFAFYMDNEQQHD